MSIESDKYDCKQSNNWSSLSDEAKSEVLTMQELLDSKSNKVSSLFLPQKIV